jgi:hypothetical protein
MNGLVGKVMSSQIVFNHFNSFQLFLSNIVKPVIKHWHLDPSGESFTLKFLKTMLYVKEERNCIVFNLLYL